MSSEWLQTTWGQVVTLDYGKAIRDYQNADGEYPVYGTNGPIGWHHTALCRTPGVIVGRKGAYRGIHYSDSPFFVIDTAFFVNPKVDMDLRWAYYCLLTYDINGMDSGSAIPSTSRDEFYKLPVVLPSKGEQVEIAKTLALFDDRITLLRETNATLEAIAQALFKSWFVDFDPVRAKMEGRAPEGMDDATAALFPDSFEESELGLVPRGWRVLRLGDATERITKGTTPTTLKRPFVEMGINFVKAESMTGDGGFIPEKFAFIDDETHELLRRSQLRDGDVLISIAGTIGRIAVMTKDYLPANTNQAVALVRPLPSVFPSGLVNRFLRLSESQQRMSEKVVQAVQANLSLGTLSDLMVVVPPESVVVKLYESGLAQIDASRAANDQSLPIRLAHQYATYSGWAMFG